MAASVAVQARDAARRGGIFRPRPDEDLAAENTALRDEMRAMKERIQVLERLATDDESDARRLDREIEKLRDRTATVMPDGKTDNGE